MKNYVATTLEPSYGRKGSPRRYGFTPTQKSNVYDAIVDSGKDGITRPDIAKKVRLPADRISFYLSDLRRAGFISVKGDPGVVSPTMGPEEAAFAALLGLENALVAAVRHQGKATDEQNRAFVKYQKIKELALRPGTGPEGKVALRMAVLELVKVVF